MKGKYFVIIILSGFLAVIVFRMMKFEKDLRRKRIVEVLVEDENMPLITRLPAEQLAAISNTANYYAMVEGDYFKVLSTTFENEQKVTKWDPIFLKGVNLGVAMPGHFPTEFSLDFNAYLQWLIWMGEMNANVVRTYTILPPSFYEAFAYYNMHYHKKKLYLLQGVWAKVPSGHDYFDVNYTREFQKEIKNVIDIIHGNAVLKPRTGSAEGVYISDISEYVIGIILGREWEPVAVTQTNSRDTVSGFTGNFVSVFNATPMEIWLSQIMEFTVHYETQQYKAQRPLSFVNWLPLDPMFHMFEYIESDEINEFDNDLESIDFTKFHASNLFQPGIFASYHVYPYYPDFIFLDKKYNKLNKQGIPDNYYAYLKDLKRHHPDMPLVIAEYGIPSSRGNSHYTTYGFHQGGHNEKEQAVLSKLLTQDVFETGCAGAVYFEWIYEWFKFNWLVMDFEQPHERRHYWHNLENPEQNFGIIAVENRVKTIDGKLNDWRNIDQSKKEFIYFDSDATYFYICAKIPELNFLKHNFYLAIDTYDENKGDHKLPYHNEIFKRGFEFLIKIKSENAGSVLVDDQYSIYTDATRNIRPVYTSKYNKNGLFVDQLLLTNRQRFSLTGDSSQSKDHNRSPLKMGLSSDPSASNADWYWNKSDQTLEIRLTWHLLNVSDPSNRYVLDDKPNTSKIEYTQTDGFHIKYYTTDKSGKLIPDDLAEKSYFYNWEPWETPEFSIRKKPLYDTLKQYFNNLNPPQPDAMSLKRMDKAFEICNFYNNKSGAVSLVFHNSCFSQYKDAIPLLDRYQLKATFGAVYDWLQQNLTSVSDEISFKLKRINLKEFKKLNLDDHEIAIQYALPDSISNKNAFVFEIKSRKKNLEQDLGQPIELVLNIGDRKMTTDILENAGFLSILNGNDGINKHNALKNNDLLSFNINNSTDPDMNELYQFLQHTNGNWIIFNYRHIFEKSTKEFKLLSENLKNKSFTITPNLFEKQIRLIRNTGFWIAPVSEVAAYLNQRNHAKIKTTVHERFIFLTLLSSSDHPMTIKYTTNSKRIRISNSASDGIYEVRDSMVFFNVIPNKEITIEDLE